MCGGVALLQGRLVIFAGFWVKKGEDFFIGQIRKLFPSMAQTVASPHPCKHIENLLKKDLASTQPAQRSSLSGVEGLV